MSACVHGLVCRPYNAVTALLLCKMHVLLACMTLPAILFQHLNQAHPSCTNTLTQPSAHMSITACLRLSLPVCCLDTSSWSCCVTGPTNFGPTAEAGTPWLQLALYTAMAQGPLTVVLVCGQRLWRLPPHLASCTHCLVWPWDLESVRAQSSPVMLESAFLLFSLNEYLSRTAVMVQPLDLPEGSDMTTLSSVQIPLPPLAKGSWLQGTQLWQGKGGTACTFTCSQAPCHVTSLVITVNCHTTKVAQCFGSRLSADGTAEQIMPACCWPKACR